MRFDGIKTKMELVSKPDATAAVWEHFGFKPNGRGEPLNLDEPVCRICFETVATKSSNTTNMHLMQSSQLRKKKKKKKKKKKLQLKLQRGCLHLPNSPQSLGRLVDKQNTNRTVQSGAQLQTV